MWRILCFFLTFLPATLATARGDSAYPRAADNIALGLERLRWGMTPAEVRLAYPDLNFTGGPVYGGYIGEAASSPGVLSLTGYRYGDCTFRMTLSFYHDRLSIISVSATNEGDRLRDCRRQVRRDFAAQYGPPVDTYPRWAGPVTALSYDRPFFSGPLTPPPGPSPLNIAFSDTRDISGHGAEQAELDKSCNHITVEVLPDTNSDGASTPIIGPTLRDLGCDFYSPISYRLLEQGKVILRVQIPVDGPIEASLANPTRSPRLNKAALDIVQKAVLIYPAIKDGKQVSVTRQIAVTFTLTHLIHGLP
jgi:TonB family protein